MWREIGPALRITLVMTVLTGIAYPLLVTGIAQGLFSKQANGSLIERNGQVIGSDLIGQQFSKPEYFHPRPSAAGNGYDPMASGGSNLGPTNAKLVDRVKTAVADYRSSNATGGATQRDDLVPPDAVLASGSGLDPHITPANALVQAARVAQARGANLGELNRLVSRNIESRDWGVFGEPRVNVLRLNLALDEQFPVRH